MKIYMIKTNKECFITDCCKFQGYDYEYHRTKLTSLYFDGEIPQKTYCKNWYVINKYPNKIEKEIIQYGNIRYEIKDINMICDKFPEIIKKEDKHMYDYDISEYYNMKQDKLPPKMVSVEDIEIEEIVEIENFKVPTVEFLAYGKKNSKDISDSTYNITNKEIKHQMLDKIIFPEIMLSSRPCSFDSKQMYDITRQYIKQNIDLSQARITSDYDFCFSVQKIVPLLEPEEISYSNIFGRTKKERNKINYRTKKYKEIKIFSMTHKQSNYDGYTSIEPMYANNEEELKEKVDTWLSGVTEIINQPLNQCPHCNGTGYAEEIKQIKINDRTIK